MEKQLFGLLFFFLYTHIEQLLIFFHWFIPLVHSLVHPVREIYFHYEPKLIIVKCFKKRKQEIPFPM